ncbi:hypothetical protein [Escherichia phage vB-Eco-KMB37]|nr:hypothetical protein [Escherichia phage vB-Eco-KMB37]
MTGTISIENTNSLRSSPFRFRVACFSEKVNTLHKTLQNTFT